MTGMVTYAGLDVHARSTHAAAIDVSTGELVRARFGPGVEEPVAWLAGLPGTVRACYEAGPTGFGLYRAAAAAGVSVEVIAPGLRTRACLFPLGSSNDRLNPLTASPGRETGAPSHQRPARATQLWAAPATSGTPA